MDMTGVVVIACLALVFLCFLIYAIYDVSQRLKRRFRRPPVQEIAYVVCSVCFCYLSGTEHTCPECNRQLFHAVSSRPRAPLQQPMSQKSKHGQKDRR